MSTDQTIPWALRVLRAFRDAMDDNKPAAVPATIIGWPKPGQFEGPYQLYVWADPDRMSVGEGTETHIMTVVISAVLNEDPSKLDETALEQAMIQFYRARVALALAAEDDGSHFDSSFEGYAQPDDERGGVRPATDRDFDRQSAIVERWQVSGACPVFTQSPE